MQQHGSKYFARRRLHRHPGDGVNRSNSIFSDVVMLRIKLKRIKNAAVF